MKRSTFLSFTIAAVLFAVAVVLTLFAPEAIARGPSPLLGLSAPQAAALSALCLTASMSANLLSAHIALQCLNQATHETPRAHVAAWVFALVAFCASAAAPFWYGYAVHATDALASAATALVLWRNRHALIAAAARGRASARSIRTIAEPA